MQAKANNDLARQITNQSFWKYYTEMTSLFYFTIIKSTFYSWQVDEINTFKCFQSHLAGGRISCTQGEQVYTFLPQLSRDLLTCINTE